jgi:hypothetical protein
MGITPPKDFEKRIEEQMRQQAENTIKIVVDRLMEIGMNAVNTIRANHAYKDQTGCLTSSVGCAVVVNGQIIKDSGFPHIKPTGEPGSKAGKAYVESLASQFPTDITLVVVAGMNYAAYVERKGIGGMTGGELYARQAVEDLLAELKE